MTRRYSDQELYEASARYGDQTQAARVLGMSPTWIGKRTRAYAKANGLAVPRNPSGHLAPEVRVPRIVVRAPDPWSHRRLRDGGVRVRDQRRTLDIENHSVTATVGIS